MSIFEYNGSAVVVKVGKNCFAIASDRPLGVQLQTVATDFRKIYRIHDRLFLSLAGLATDCQTLYQRFVFRHKLYQLREERDMKPGTFASLVSAILYEKRFAPDPNVSTARNRSVLSGGTRSSLKHFRSLLNLSHSEN